jgi:uncharacterized protein YggE
MAKHNVKHEAHEQGMHGAKAPMSNALKITLMITATVLIVSLVIAYVFLQLRAPQHTVNVNGQATIKALPDIISVYFNVETAGNTAQAAKDNNSAVVDKLTTNIIAAGFKKSDVVTQDFSVTPAYKWEYDQQILTGYVARHTIKIELSVNKTDKVGQVIDAGVNAGAGISYVNFELSDAKLNTYKAEALKQATLDARTKADSIAQGLGMKVSDIMSISDSSFDYYPWPIYEGGLAMNAEAAKAAATNIQPGEKDVSARVTVTFKLK